MDVKSVIRLADAVWRRREAVNAQMEEMARYIYPDGWPSSVGELHESGENRRDIWDSTPEEAAGMLAAALGSLLTNPSAGWFALDLVDGNAAGETGHWLNDVTRRMLDALADPGTRFYEEVTSFYMDLPVFGWAVLLSEFRDGTGLVFKAVPPAQCALAEDASGGVDTVVRRFSLNAAQMAEEYGQENLSDKIRQSLANDGDAMFDLVHVVAPCSRLSREGGAVGAHPFVSMVFEKETEHPLRTGGYFEMPYACPRWSKRPGEIYGRGPGHGALPDIRVLNRVSLSQLDAAEKASNPPLLVPDDGTIDRKINTFAGGITYWAPGHGDITPLPVPANLETMQLIREERKDAIRRLFLNDRIQLVGGPRMTATEVIARERRQMLVLGPVLGRLQTEFLGPLVSRVFRLLLRAGCLPEIPEHLAGRDLKVRYVSPIARAQKQTEAESFSRALEYMAPLVQANPRLLDNFDGDSIVRDTQDVFGYPAKYLRDEESVVRERHPELFIAQAATDLLRPQEV